MVQPQAFFRRQARSWEDLDDMMRALRFVVVGLVILGALAAAVGWMLGHTSTPIFGLCLAMGAPGILLMQPLLRVIASQRLLERELRK